MKRFLYPVRHCDSSIRRNCPGVMREGCLDTSSLPCIIYLRHCVVLRVSSRHFLRQCRQTGLQATPACGPGSQNRANVRIDPSLWNSTLGHKRDSNSTALNREAKRDKHSRHGNSAEDSKDRNRSLREDYQVTEQPRTSGKRVGRVRLSGGAIQ